MRQILEPTLPGYMKLVAELREWLAVLGYAESSVREIPRRAEEFLAFLEINGVEEIASIQKENLQDFLFFLQTRENYRRTGKLSQSHINKYIQSLKLLSKYVRQTGQGIFTLKAPMLKRVETQRKALSKSEVRQLYQACSNSLMGHRDRAMLSLAYGCGLRRNELENLWVEDVLEERKLIFVRKGKNYKQRYVPMHEQVLKDITKYVSITRTYWIKGDYNELFISSYGPPLSSQSLAKRLEQLAKKTGIDKPVSLHVLRHSIATHLLNSGMNIHQISKFLGHTSLESTQIYTHLS